MIRVLSIIITICIASISLNAKTLVVYYSYTNNIEQIVNTLKNQITCDVVEIEPAEKGLDYAANGYAIGSALISAIRNSPDDAASYPGIDPTDVNLDEYDSIFLGFPIWGGTYALPIASFLEDNNLDGKEVVLIKVN